MCQIRHSILYMNYVTFILHNNLGGKYIIIIIPFIDEAWTEVVMPKDRVPQIKCKTVGPPCLHSAQLRYYFFQFAHTVVISSKAYLGGVEGI